MTGIELEMETGEGGNLSGSVFCLSKGQVNRPAEYLMSAGNKQPLLSPCSGCLGNRVISSYVTNSVLCGQLYHRHLS